MKGIDIVVAGSVGHMSAFMAQTGRLVVCGDAGDFLGDSIYEAVIYVAGKVGELGADCVEKEMTPEHRQGLADFVVCCRRGSRPGQLPALWLSPQALQFQYRSCE